MTAIPPTRAELDAMAAQFGISDGMLDAAVEEAAHELAADRFNSGALPDLDFWDAHDQVHDDADAQASRINSDGVTAQLEFLSEGCTRTALYTLLRDLLTPS